MALQAPLLLLLQQTEGAVVKHGRVRLEAKQVARKSVEVTW